MAIAVVLVVMGVVGIVSARFAALWWARQPLGAVRLDGSVEVRVGARRVDADGRCGDSGELAIAAGRLEVTVAGRTIVSTPLGRIGATVPSDPRPFLRLSGDGWNVSLVVDRERPVPVVVGRIGELRQAATAQVVVDALREAVATADAEHVDGSPDGSSDGNLRPGDPGPYIDDR